MNQPPSNPTEVQEGAEKHQYTDKLLAKFVNDGGPENDQDKSKRLLFDEQFRIHVDILRRMEEAGDDVSSRKEIEDATSQLWKKATTFTERLFFYVFFNHRWTQVQIPTTEYTDFETGKYYALTVSPDGTISKTQPWPDGYDALQGARALAAGFESAHKNFNISSLRLDTEKK